MCQLETSILISGVWLRNRVGGPLGDIGAVVSVCVGVWGQTETPMMWSQWCLVSPPLAGMWIP